MKQQSQWEIDFDEQFSLVGIGNHTCEGWNDLGDELWMKARLDVETEKKMKQFIRETVEPSMVHVSVETGIYMKKEMKKRLSTQRQSLIRRVERMIATTFSPTGGISTIEWVQKSDVINILREEK